MSWNSISLMNPDIDKGSQLARRQAEGIEDIYFSHTSEGKGKESYDTVDLSDEVTRKVDARTLPLDTIEEHERYKEVNGKNYLVGYQDVGYGKHVPYLREVLGRNYYSDTKMALIGGKLYQIEFEKDPETRKISTFLTTPVGDLFQNDKFLAGQTPAQKLELLGKIRKSATYITWYDSGEYNRYSRAKYDGEIDPQLDPSKVKDYPFDAGALELLRGLEKEEAQPAKEPLPTGLGQVAFQKGARDGLGIGVAHFVGGFAARPATGAFVPEGGTPIVAPKSTRRRVQWQPQTKQLASSFDSPRNWRRFN